MSSNQKLKVFIHAVDVAGHINSCVGFGQALVKRGHTVFFLSNQSFKGQFSIYGFTEILLKDHLQLAPTEQSESEQQKNANPDKPIKLLAAQLMKAGMLSNESPLEKIKNSGSNQGIGNILYDKSVAYNGQIKEAINLHKPDLIVVDHFFVVPSIMHSGLPWIMLFSSNPLFLYNSEELPPYTSGFGINSDRDKWEEFRIYVKKRFNNISDKKQNEILKHFGYPEIEWDTILPRSPYLNVYGYPEELDYHDVVPRPDNLVAVDAFSRKIPEPFELPVEFKNKIKPGDKLVYVSLGSMGSFNIELMKRMVEILSKTEHKYIVSKGPLHEEYELGENMWGDEYLPQTSILPLVDLVITHGGNNTVTETLCFGKPMIVMPMFADQFDNAQRIEDKGFGVRLNAHEYTEQELVDSVNRLLNDAEINQKLQTISKRIELSNSKEKACIKIEQFVEQFVKNSQN